MKTNIRTKGRWRWSSDSSGERARLETDDNPVDMVLKERGDKSISICIFESSENDNQEKDANVNDDERGKHPINDHTYNVRHSHRQKPYTTIHCSRFYTFTQDTKATNLP